VKGTICFNKLTHIDTYNISSTKHRNVTPIRIESIFSWLMTLLWSSFALNANFDGNYSCFVLILERFAYTLEARNSKLICTVRDCVFIDYKINMLVLQIKRIRMKTWNVILSRTKQYQTH